MLDAHPQLQPPASPFPALSLLDSTQSQSVGKRLNQEQGVRETPNPSKKCSLQTQAPPTWCLWLLLRPPGAAFPDCAGRPLGCPGAKGGLHRLCSRTRRHRRPSTSRCQQGCFSQEPLLTPPIPCPPHGQAGAPGLPHHSGPRCHLVTRDQRQQNSGPCQCCTWARRKGDTIRDLTLTAQGLGGGGAGEAGAGGP